MAAAPKYGTMMFRGLASGKSYAVDVYHSDVANALVNWDSGNGAGTGSLTYYKAPEDMVLYDYSVVTGLTDTTNISLTADGSQIPNARLRYTQFVNTIAFRPTLAIGFKRGTNVGAIQVA